MPKRTAVAIYARISQDRDGDGLGVTRQLTDCRAEAAKLGWEVAEEYVDDDVSAWSGKTRPAYERMLADVGARERDAIVAWHLDRLYRRPIELERLINVCAAVGLSDLRTVHGSYDLGSGDQLMAARFVVAVAANESDKKRIRAKRKMLEIAEAGRPHGGGTRPFGFEKDRITHNREEAEVIRQLASRVLAGESLASVARWLAKEDGTPVTGAPWRTPVLRQLLLNPRIYGIRVHEGKPIGPAVWEPIISPEQGAALHSVLTDPSRAKNRGARRYLLSGLCRCARCGTTMVSVPRYEERRYLCRSGHDFGGCGSMAISAAPTEKIAAEMVMMRLDTPELHDAIAGKVRDDAQAAALSEQVRADTEQLAELATMWAEKVISTTEWSTARKTIERRRDTARKRLASMSGTRALDEYIGQGHTLRDRWDSLNLDRQVAITKAVVEHFVIHPGVRGARGVAVERIQPVWRF